ncbi:cuticle protein 8-like [Panulirus ornatus]|uniref:cuticle protein 8-like n=1 Tax=Panulirus ornatus TaxID=150431 RepID=UPI003A8B0FD3
MLHHHSRLTLTHRQHYLPTTTTMSFKLILLAALVVLAAGIPQGKDDYPPANYNFEWAVDDAESGNFYNQQESRDGDNTEGRYEVVQPDGLKRVVVYTVGEDQGFQPEVTYE